MSRTNTRGNTYRRAAGRTGLLVALAMAVSLATAPLAAAQEDQSCHTQTPRDSLVNSALNPVKLSLRSTSLDDPSPTRGVAVEFTLSHPSGVAVDHYCNDHGDPATRHEDPPGTPVIWNHKDLARTQHIYNTPGNYTVQRVAFDGPGVLTPAGRSDIATTGSFYVNSPPTVSFTASPSRPLVGQRVTFTATSSDSDGPIRDQDHAWDLDGDGQFDDGPTARTVPFAYTTAGSRGVRVQVTDAKLSKRASAVGTITVLTPAQAQSGNGAGGSLSVGPAPTKAKGPNVDDLLTDVAACSIVTRGTRRNDRITGTRASDRLLGLSGNDILSGLAGVDCLVGGPGQDRLSGGYGSDRLTGGSGSDRLTGGAGADVLSGGSGANRLYGGAGADTLNAVNGRRDMVSCGSGRDSARVDRVDIVRGCERLRRT